MEYLKTGFLICGEVRSDAAPPITAPSTTAASGPPRLKPRSPSPAPCVVTPAISQALLAQYDKIVNQSKTMEEEKQQLRQKLLELHDTDGEVQPGALFLSVTERLHVSFSNKDMQLFLGIASPPEGWVQAMLLVESPEHGRHLQQYLPDWPLMDLTPGIAAGNRAFSGTTTKGAIVTLSWARRFGLACQVLVRADAGGAGLLPTFGTIALSNTADNGNNPNVATNMTSTTSSLALIDFHGASDGRHGLDHRVHEYQRQGWIVRTSRTPAITKSSPPSRLCRRTVPLTFRTSASPNVRSE